MRPALLAPVLIAASLLAGCDVLGIESASTVAARREADGKAVGGACRHAGRAIEDCYVLNRRAERAAVYAGWREMDDYMRENKLAPVAPQIQPETSVAAAKPAEDDEDAADAAATRASSPAAEKSPDAATRRRRAAP